ncbi:MAG: flagellar basal body P-ring protein FlgI, partial [Alphaproteobacteria bacterium]|nr:flagellar basal body P-ring protein FlgI [Alphaproteobacteria bacterium]
MKWSVWLVAALGLTSLLWAPAAHAQARIRDIVNVEGVRQNDLVGYGIVVGLNGTGDSVRNSPFTEDSLTHMLERLGVNVQGEEIKPKNVAAVLVTASLPAFARNGSSIDVSVSSIGDASSLEGGTLILTPLKGADNEVYAVAQGSIIVSGIDVKAQAARETRGTPTGGSVPNGARIEREVNFEFNQRDSIVLALRNPDFTTAARIEDTI